MVISLQIDRLTEVLPKLEAVNSAASTAAENRRVDLAQRMAEFSAYMESTAKAVVKVQPRER